MSHGEHKKAAKTEHTPEPWRVSEWFLNDKDGALEACGMQIVDSNNNLICAQTIESSATEEEETLRRIVACVNACTGFSTEELEDVVNHGGFIDQTRYNAKVTKQRDELLATLEQIVVANPRKWEELAEPQSEFELWAKSRANHAIAIAKGQS